MTTIAVPKARPAINVDIRTTLQQRVLLLVAPHLVVEVLLVAGISITVDAESTRIKVSKLRKTIQKLNLTIKTKTTKKQKTVMP